MGATNNQQGIRANGEATQPDAPQRAVRTADPVEDEHWWKASIRKECGHGPFLNGLTKSVIAYFKAKEEEYARSKGQTKNGPITREEIILKIQYLAQAHYQALWAACSREEQYVLYDLAQDGLVNTKDMEVITGLLSKGLLIYDGTLWIMNRSFRNFILTAIRSEGSLLMERESKQRGAWNEFKIPLMLVVVAMSCFIFLTQKETFNQILAIIASLAALLPLLPKMLGAFSGLNGKSENKE